MSKQVINSLEELKSIKGQLPKGEKTSQTVKNQPQILKLDAVFSHSTASHLFFLAFEGNQVLRLKCPAVKEVNVGTTKVRVNLLEVSPLEIWDAVKLTVIKIPTAGEPTYSIEEYSKIEEYSPYAELVRNLFKELDNPGDFQVDLSGTQRIISLNPGLVAAQVLEELPILTESPLEEAATAYMSAIEELFEVSGLLRRYLLPQQGSQYPKYCFFTPDEVGGTAEKNEEPA